MRPQPLPSVGGCNFIVVAKRRMRCLSIWPVAEGAGVSCIRTSIARNASAFGYGSNTSRRTARVIMPNSYELVQKP